MEHRRTQILKAGMRRAEARWPRTNLAADWRECLDCFLKYVAVAPQSGDSLDGFGRFGPRCFIDPGFGRSGLLIQAKQRTIEGRDRDHGRSRAQNMEVHFVVE